MDDPIKPELTLAQQKSRLYKKVSLYNPDTRKPRVVCIKKSDFDTPEELDAYCKKIREENKVKNAEWRKQKRLERYIDNRNVLNTQMSVPLESLVLPDTKEINTLKHHSSVQLEGIRTTTGSTIVIYGSSKRGKSTLMMHIYKKYFMSKDKINTLFSGNPHLKVYKKDKRLLVSYGFTGEHSKYVQMQQYVNVKTENQYQFTDLFDDIIDQKHAGIINKLILTYRNANISMIMCLQYVYLLSKQNRANVNHTFVFGMNSVEDIRGVIELILRPYLTDLGFASVDDQIRFFKEVTADHGFFYIDNVKSKISFHRLKIKK